MAVIKKTAAKSTAKKTAAKKPSAKNATFETTDKAQVIKPLKIGDYTEQEGIVKKQITRGVTINDKTQNLTVAYAVNNKKGTYKISFDWNNDAITGDKVQDSATLLVVNQMQMTLL